MKRIAKIVIFVGVLSVSALAGAQTPTGAPAGSTGMCRDGTYYSGGEKKGACRGHKGVKDWYATSGAATATAAAPAAMPAAMPAPMPAATPAAAATTTKERYTPPATAAAGGGAGQVWVNSKSNVYHCMGDKWYGKTKQGEYLTEAAAKAKGAHPDHGKACS